MDVPKSEILSKSVCTRPTAVQMQLAHPEIDANVKNVKNIKMFFLSAVACLPQYQFNLTNNIPKIYHIQLWADVISEIQDIRGEIFDRDDHLIEKTFPRDSIFKDSRDSIFKWQRGRGLIQSGRSG